MNQRTAKTIRKFCRVMGMTEKQQKRNYNGVPRNKRCLVRDEMLGALGMK